MPCSGSSACAEAYFRPAPASTHVISKRKLVNTLFALAFPVYGIGSYLMFVPGHSWSTGLFFATGGFASILVFFLIDLVYRRGITSVVNGTFWTCMLALISFAASVLLGLHYHSPVLKPSNATAIIAMALFPFPAAVVVQIYNRHEDGFDFAALLLKGLLLLVGANLLGVGAGLHNGLHSFSDRTSFPFVLGIYESAHLLAFINLMLIFYLRDFDTKPLRFIGIVALFLVNMAVIMSVNSRLSFMIFFFVTVMFITKAIKAARWIYTVSLFTLPLMMSFALLIYQILSLPFFVAILSRVNKKDVTTFNGRTYIWESGWDWVVNDRRGLLFGNGYNGQYHVRLLEGVAKLWEEPNSYNLHMHSAFFEILVDQGIVGILLMYAVYWIGYRRYRAEYMANTAMAPLFAGFTYLLFVWQIDITGYSYYMGYMLLFMLMAPVCIKPGAITGKRKALNGTWLK